MSKFGEHTGDFEAMAGVDQILHLENVHRQLPAPDIGWGTFEDRVKGHDGLHTPQGEATAKVADAMTAEFEHRLYHVLEHAFDAGAAWAGTADHSPGRDLWIDTNFTSTSAFLRGLGFRL